jgi:hypothetical protein
MLGNSWAAAQLAASQEGLSSMSEWVSISIAGQRVAKHILVATNTQATVEEFTIFVLKSIYKKEDVDIIMLHLHILQKKNVGNKNKVTQPY